MSTPTSRALTAACGPRSVLLFATSQHHCAHLSLVPLDVHLHAPRPAPQHQLCYSMHTQGEEYIAIGEQVAPRASAATSKSWSTIIELGSCHLLWPPSLCVSANDPCYYLDTCSWPLQPSTCILLVLATTAAYPAAENPNSPYSHFKPPAVLAKNHTVVNSVKPSGLSQRDTMSPRIQFHHMTTYLAP